MKSSLLILLLLCGTALAYKHPPAPDSDYQDGVLTRMETVSTGTSCSSSSNGKVDDDGNIQTNGSGNCSSNQMVHYTVTVGNQVYVLERALTHPKTAIFTMGYSSAFQKQSVLYMQPMGTHVRARVEKDKMFVKIGDRESPYHVVGLSSVQK